MPPRRSTLIVTAIALLLVSRRRRERRLTERVAAAALETLLNAIDANDHDTGAHVRRVAAYALVLARAAGLSPRECHGIERVALFHDIGKIHAALFDIVHEDVHVSAHERALIASHPQRGADVLHPLATFYPDLEDGVLSHHERWDGSGYPRGLRSEEIPLAARIVSIADTFDAVTHGRRYQRERSFDTARHTILEGRGTQFDPALVDLFLAPETFERIEREHRLAHAPRRRRVRPPLPARDVPDITFRWRSESLARRPGGRPSRTPLE